MEHTEQVNLVGFSGTRHGLASEQRSALAKLIQTLKPSEFHHGDCVGADDEAATLVKELCPWCVLVGHPPAESRLRAQNPATRVWQAPLPYLARNRAIVADTELLVACPATGVEQPRGGTWQTIRYARQCRRRVYLVGPNGAVELCSNRPLTSANDAKLSTSRRGG
jgi:hypothetical protein